MLANNPYDFDRAVFRTRSACI